MEEAMGGRDRGGVGRCGQREGAGSRGSEGQQVQHDDDDPLSFAPTSIHFAIARSPCIAERKYEHVSGADE
jgi:hypothetical protein